MAMEITFKFMLLILKSNSLTDQKLFVAECNVSGIIKFYNKQLQYLGNITHRVMNARDIFINIHQNLYVNNFGNSCVHVFSKFGIHLRSFGHDKKQLKSPWGLCVHGHYVYVTDVSDCVFVFTTDGEYLTSFGQEGRKEGMFYSPLNICADNT